MPEASAYPNGPRSHSPLCGSVNSYQSQHNGAKFRQTITQRSCLELRGSSDRQARCREPFGACLAQPVFKLHVRLCPHETAPAAAVDAPVPFAAALSLRPVRPHAACAAPGRRAGDRHAAGPGSNASAACGAGPECRFGWAHRGSRSFAGAAPLGRTPFRARPAQCLRVGVRLMPVLCQPGRTAAAAAACPSVARSRSQKPAPAAAGPARRCPWAAPHSARCARRTRACR